MTVEVKFDAAMIEKILRVATEKGWMTFFKLVRERVADFIPEDSSSMIQSDYVRRMPDGTIILAYGSPVGDERIDKVVIHQHEDPLHHWGFPKGHSMREGVPGASIPGGRWIVGGSFLYSEPYKNQRKYYEKGYSEKKAAGILTQYPTKFLEKAITAVANNALDSFKEEK